MGLGAVEEPRADERPGYSGRSETRYDHPAYGLVGFARSQVGGRGVSLAGSDHAHHAVVGMEVKTAYRVRADGRDHYHADRLLVSVEMTETQWARLVSSGNFGDGVPCTLAFAEGDHRASLPPPAPGEEHSREMKATLARAAEKIGAVEAAVEELGAKLPRAARDELLKLVRSARREVADTAPYAERQFDLHMERSVDAARAEVEAHAQAVALRLGVGEVRALTALPGAVERG